MCAEPSVERRASIRSAVTRSELCADYGVRTPAKPMCSFRSVAGLSALWVSITSWQGSARPQKCRSPWLLTFFGTPAASSSPTTGTHTPHRSTTPGHRQVKTPRATQDEARAGFRIFWGMEAARRKRRKAPARIFPRLSIFLPSMIGGSAQRSIRLKREYVNAGPSREQLCHYALLRASCSATHRKQEVKGAIGGPARVPEDVKSEKPRKSRERKRSKRLIRQQPERKEKYRERQCRANRKQHYNLSKPSARHDMQRQRNECDLLPA